SIRVNRLQLIIHTHVDDEHIGSSGSAVLNLLQRELYDNPLSVRSIRQRQLLARIIPRHLVRDDALVFAEEVRAKVLYPPPALSINSADDAPLILRLMIRDKTSVLFESDAGAEAEAAVLASDED